MSDEQNDPEMVYVPMGTGELLYYVTRLALATQKLSASIEILARGDTSNAARLAGEAGRKIDEVVDGIVAKLKNAVDVD